MIKFEMRYFYQMKSLFIFFLFYTSFTFTQTKYEVEKRIKKDEVPQNAQDFIYDFSPQKKVKWFKEKGSNSSSFEAKFHHDNHFYSVEFDTTGKIEDVELLINKDEVEKEILIKIEDYLTSSLERFKIQKIQIQYTGDKELLIGLRNVHTASISQLQIAYELVVKGKKENQIVLIEFHFNQKGVLIDESKLELQNFDHLEY